MITFLRDILCNDVPGGLLVEYPHLLAFQDDGFGRRKEAVVVPQLNGCYILNAKCAIGVVNRASACYIEEVGYGSYIIDLTMYCKKGICSPLEEFHLLVVVRCMLVLVTPWKEDHVGSRVDVVQKLEVALN